MTTSTIITCDVCGAQKKETNRWFIVAVSTFPPYVAVNCAENRDRIPVKLSTKDVCGESCATRLIQQWFASGSIEEPPPGVSHD